MRTQTREQRSQLASLIVAAAAVVVADAAKTFCNLERNQHAGWFHFVGMYARTRARAYVLSVPFARKKGLHEPRYLAQS